LIALQRSRSQPTPAACFLRDVLTFRAKRDGVRCVLASLFESQRVRRILASSLFGFRLSRRHLVRKRGMPIISVIRGSFKKATKETKSEWASRRRGERANDRTTLQLSRGGERVPPSNDLTLQCREAIRVRSRNSCHENEPEQESPLRFSSFLCHSTFGFRHSYHPCNRQFPKIKKVLTRCWHFSYNRRFTACPP
jgi:hypothetical protein